MSAVGFVWNKGIAAQCDWRIPDEFASGEYRPVPTLAGVNIPFWNPGDLISDPGRYAAIREGDLIWVRLSWMRSFIRQVLPHIRARFVLVTGDSDSSVPSSMRWAARKLTKDPRLLRWYAQNCDSHSFSEKIRPLPIGIDFHSVSERLIWGEQIASPEAQEQTLLDVRASLPPLEQRSPAAYIDFGWQQARKGNRRGLVRELQGNPNVVVQEGPLPRTALWRRRGSYAFVISPHGEGIDCHRTWESLALGHIVLAPDSPLNPLYENLPVITLRSWKELNADNLKRWHARCSGPSETLEPLHSAYWVSRMRNLAN
jgi:hypothetical protein